MLDDVFSLSGRTAIVTGAARGIGAAIARRMHEAGAIVHGIDAEPPRQTPQHCASLRQVDITDGRAVAAAVEEIGSRATVLVNNAGITRDRSLLKMSEEEWRAVLDVNLTGAFTMIRAVAPGMAAAGGGAIINITSINGLRGKFGQANYAASKAGLIGLTKTAARELGRRRIRVNAVAPGMVLTDMALQLPQEFRDRALAEAALDRLAEPDDIANAVLFLASEAGRMITGQVLVVDGGQYM